MQLHSTQVAFHPLSYGDWGGRVFWWEGNIYRAINQARAGFYKQLIADGVIRDLVRQNLLIDTEIAEIELDGYSLVLKHRTVPFVSYAHEWCGEMLKAAALSVLELEKELRTHRLTLEDPHPCNVLFIGTTPMWVDLGSLWPLGRAPSSHAGTMFSSHFTGPLKIMAAGHIHIARCLLQDGYYSGVDERDVQALTGSVSAEVVQLLKAEAKSVARKLVPSSLRSFLRHSVQHLRRQPSTDGTINLERAASEIQDINLTQASTIFSVYDRDFRQGGMGFPEFDSTSAWTKKHRSVAQILSVKKPRSVLDIGSNRGWFSQLAARNGAQVVSLDFDEFSATKLFFDARRARLPILPFVSDFRKLNPVMGSAAGPGIAPANRVRCEMVLALGLVHHLVSTHWLTFDKIIEDLSLVAEKWLVIEFVGREDPYVREWINSREWIGNRYSWYNLDNLLAALSKSFSTIDLFPSNMEHRQIVACGR